MHIELDYCSHKTHVHRMDETSASTRRGTHLDRDAFLHRLVLAGGFSIRQKNAIDVRKRAEFVVFAGALSKGDHVRKGVRSAVGRSLRTSQQSRKCFRRVLKTSLSSCTAMPSLVERGEKQHDCAQTWRVGCEGENETVEGRRYLEGERDH